MVASQGILTVRGGRTSHAAVVARGMGPCCVAGCGAIKIDEEAKKFIETAHKYNLKVIVDYFDGAYQTEKVEMFLKNLGQDTEVRRS